MATVKNETLLSLIVTCMLLYFTKNVDCATHVGGHIFMDTVWRRAASPYFVDEDVLVRPRVTLTIEPGVEVKFKSKVMLAVNGTLIAKGLPQSRILMTRQAAVSGGPPEWPSDIRLVDERSVLFGRLQMFHKGRWRGICANFQNWTETDTTVACRQLGFNWGNFSFLSWARNDSLYMLYHRPMCLGNENHMMQCGGARNAQIGARICVNQQTVHLHCYGVAPNSPALENWWGLEFYNASFTQIINDKVGLNMSSSLLENIDIMHAGVDKAGEPVPAIRASPHAPHLIDVNLMFNALDGTNYTDLKGSTHIERTTIARNRGHGLVVETHIGHFTIKDSDISENTGDGIKAKFLDGKWIVFDNTETFCELANLGDMRFPQIMIGYPMKHIATGCSKLFTTKLGDHLTLNIVEMEKEEDASGELMVYDGRYNTDPLLARIPITNGTLPQGITSKLNQMLIHFTWNTPWQCNLLRECVKFTIIVDTGPETVPEFYMNNTYVRNNTGHGMFIENVRNNILVNASDVSHNRYGAGLQVLGGAGDITVNSSTFLYNNDNGVNITYGGGYRIFNMSEFSHNYGNGINITFNETRVDNKTRIPKHQRTEVFRSHFQLNDGIGVRVGNFCQKGNAIVNDSFFIQNKQQGVEFDSCYQLISPQNRTNFTVGYNIFRGNLGHAVKITPLLNAVGRIANNTFSEHPKYTLLIDNTDDFLLSRTFKLYPVNYEVDTNIFRKNQGYYVANVRLTEESEEQRLIFRYNRFENNIIQGAFPNLNPRTRAFGVVVLSSSNVNFTRNAMLNPKSKYEVTTHLLKKNVQLNVALQWWGSGVQGLYESLIHRLFDQLHRYNLARIAYHPALRYDDLWGNYITDTLRPADLPFNRPGNVLGGQIPWNNNPDGQYFTTHPGVTYYVDRDINILPAGKLTVSPGSVLLFDNSVGMLVQGEFKVNGVPGNNVSFTLGNDTTITNSSKVRLVGGATEYEGRVEVRPNPSVDQWGTICKQGWSIMDASVVCQMMGMVVHPDDWKPISMPAGQAHQPIWRSYVQCTDHDMDITECEADHQNDHSCDHSMDVSVRCKPPTWAGMRFLATARPGILHHMSVTKAGLLDPTTIWYAPAIRIDYNVHSMLHTQVSQCMATGIEIMKNDVYANAKIRYSNITDNLGVGMLVRGSFFEAEFTHYQNNFRHGFEFNPTYTTVMAQEIRQGIHECRMLNGNMTVTIPNAGYMFLCTQYQSQIENTLYEIQLKVSLKHRLVVDILDYNPETQIENVIIYDNSKENKQPFTQRWRIEEDLVDFPIESRLNDLYMTWQVTGAPSGRLTFIVRSKPIEWAYPVSKLTLRNCTFDGNLRGVVTRHYNQPSNEYLDLFFRHRLELITMFGVHITRSREEAIHAPSITKYHDLYMPSYEELQTPLRLAEITYRLDGCQIYNNERAIRAEHNHVEFSNNVWIWEVYDNEVMNNRDGGFMIELPKVNVIKNIPADKFNHTVDINNNDFHDNTMFNFRIDGFYCNATVVFNRFFRNQCRVGCIAFTGTEKEMDVRSNDIKENVGQYIMEFYMNSHMYYTMWIDARVELNDFKLNRKAQMPGAITYSSSPTTYTLGTKGLQNITINRNLFHNTGMDYELVAGQASSVLENYLDVRENYWGSQDQNYIKEKIFDFDDWNNYAIAEYYPYLLQDSFNSPVFTGSKIENRPDLNKPLGGRIEGHFVIPRRSQPYIVTSDLTVMPTGSLVVERGAELHFHPNIGILVLGSMSARGDTHSRVRFRPVKRPAGNLMMKRDIGENGGPYQTGQIRLNGGDTSNDGFMEIYNATEGRWAIVCDHNFNDRTAEVACRSMGKEDSNVIVRRSQLYDHFVFGYPKMHEQQVEWFWRTTHICDGMEPSMEYCRYRLNYDIRQCMERRDYVYVRCGPRNLDPAYDYWGNIRFSTRHFEHDQIVPGYSFIEFLDIEGAGILHGEKSAAVESVYRTPRSNYVKVEKCAWNGYEYIAPKDEFLVANGWIENNNGYGLGGLVLNTESRYTVPQSSYIPLYESTIPYNVFGLVRMCTTEKMIDIQDRILIYYKYRFETIDCLKIIRSKERFKTIAVRFLQVNMYNDTYYENAVEMYNGEYLEPDFLIAKITGNVTEYDRSIKYETAKGYDVMGLRVTASPAYGTYGFIAEVVTIPQSSLPGPRGTTFTQKILRNTMTRNQQGGLRFQNAGELNPSVVIEENQIMHSGVKMLNMTGPPVMHINIQNSHLLTVANNHIAKNQGGTYVISYTNSQTTALYANITNNYIVDNSLGDSLHVEGHHYQNVEVISNYIAHNKVSFRNVVAMFGVNLNFTNNVMYNNTGRSNINCTAPEQVKVNQRYYGNSLHDNVAIGKDFATIYVGSAKHQFTNNFLVNRWNIFEMTTYNRTRYPDYHQYPKIDAAHNWWGQGYEAFVSGKIWHRRDDDNLIEVIYEPFDKTNQTTLEGRCHPGWRQHDKKCFMYMGGVASFDEAKQSCLRERSTLAWSRNREMEHYFGELMASSQSNYTDWRRAWVYAEWKKQGFCTCIRNFLLEHTNCEDRHPYICERDPYMIASVDWLPMIIGGSVAGGVLILIIILIVLGCLKSKGRAEQKMERRNSIRASLRSSRASLYSSKATLSRGSTETIDSIKRSRPRLDHYNKGVVDISGVTMEETSDTDTTIDKMKMYQPSIASSSIAGVPALKAEYAPSSYHDSELPIGYRPPRGQRPPRLENEVANIMARPMYDHVIRNDSYDQHSIDGRQLRMNPAQRGYPSTSRSIGDPSNRGYPSTSRSIGDFPVFPKSPPSPGYGPTPVSLVPGSKRSSTSSLTGQGSMAGIVPFPMSDDFEDVELTRPISKKPARPKPRETAM